MPLPMRALVLRTAVERVIDAAAELIDRPAGIRIYAPAPPPTDENGWLALLAALRTADRWGTTDADGTVRVWADIDDESRGTP